MRSDADAMQAYLDTVFAWREGNLDLRMPDGESGAEVHARFDDVARATVPNGSTVMLDGDPATGWHSVATRRGCCRCGASRRC